MDCVDNKFGVEVRAIWESSSEAVSRSRSPAVSATCDNSGTLHSMTTAAMKPTPMISSSRQVWRSRQQARVTIEGREDVPLLLRWCGACVACAIMTAPICQGALARRGRYAARALGCKRFRNRYRSVSSKSSMQEAGCQGRSERLRELAPVRVARLGHAVCLLRQQIDLGNQEINGRLCRLLERHRRVLRSEERRVGKEC